jgi:hypothetical protein
MLLLLLALPLLAQKVKTVEGEYVYYAPENVTMAAAKDFALRQAQLKAIADEFGTIISHSNLTKIETSNDVSKTNFISLGSSDVKGEWIETVGKPDFNIVYEEGMLVVSCKVKGKAREIVSSKVDILAKTLRNGTEEKFESEEFRKGDDLFLMFQSPTNGYLAVYLVDDDEQVQCLLPYLEQQDGIYQVHANQRYVLFSQADDPLTRVDEYKMLPDRDLEHYQMYVIFSPNKFAKAVDRTSEKATDAVGISGFPRELSFEDFHKWLARCRRHDADMTLKKIILTIKK